MGLIVPNPTVPTDGQPVEATTLAANLNAVYQAIQSFDASQVASGTLSAGALAASINPNTILHDTLSSFVYSGCVWSSVSGLSGTMSSGVAYIANATGMFRVSVSSVGSNTFTASKDTYIDIDYNGNITYNAVSNGASAPALTANSIRVALVVTNGSAITSVTKTGVDSNNVQIYPTSPSLPLNWMSYTPTLGGITSVGSGSNIGKYIKIGKTIIVEVLVTLGSGFSWASGNLIVSLPVTANTSFNKGESTFGNATAWFAHSGADMYPGVAIWVDANNVGFRGMAASSSTGPVHAGSFATVNPTYPFTWTTNDWVHCAAIYEAA